MNDPKTTPKTEAQLLPLAEAGDMNAALELAKLYLETHNPALYKWANTLCAANKPEGYYLLGKCYEFGIAVKADHAEAERLYRQSAAMGFPRALTGIVSLLMSDPEKRGANTPEIIRLLKQAVKEGDEKAMYVLSSLYKSGTGVARSEKKQWELLCRSAELGYVPAMAALGEFYLKYPNTYDEGIRLLNEAMRLGDTSAKATLDKIRQSGTSDTAVGTDKEEVKDESHELIKKMARSVLRKDKMITDAEAGIAEAQYMLGCAYYNGTTEDYMPFDKDIDKACEWFEKAAVQGHEMASYTLGEIAEDAEDFESAIKWFLPIATKGFADAATHLGIAFGATHQYEEAFLWLKKAAETGDGMAISRLGALYAMGQGVKKDMDEAIRLFALSAKTGDPFGCVQLAKFHLYSDQMDVPTAEAALIKAANAGIAPAQFMLAEIYLGAYGEEYVDFPVAEDLLLDAANQGDVKARYTLGIFYYYVVKNKEWAYKFLSDAASEGSQDAKTALHNLFGVE